MEITFKKGLPGFNGFKGYEIKDVEELGEFKLLQCKEDNELGLIVVSPFFVDKDYELKLNEEIILSLKIEKPEDVVLFSTVTLNEDPSKMTTNLKAPIVINVNNGFAEQLITENEKYKIKHPIFKG